MVERLSGSTAAIGPEYFDPNDTIENLSRRLPHWRQPGKTYFVTFRLADSIPRNTLRQWASERDAWLKTNPEPHDESQRRDYYERFTGKFQHWLDQGHGACLLKHGVIRSMVEHALRHFHGNRYELDHFVVMPNHLHAIVTPMAELKLSGILHSWKSFTANEINRKCGTRGTLWQKESFDHIVRSVDSLEKFREYIRQNARVRKHPSSGGMARLNSSWRLDAPRPCGAIPAYHGQHLILRFWSESLKTFTIGP